MPSLALIANPDSGDGGANAIAEELRRLGAEVDEFGLDAVDEAARSGAERLVVAGGDGSIAPAALAAASADVPLAVIATGTANDFARAHELPRKIDAACELAVTGTREERLDLALIDGRPFLNVASLGLPPAAAQAAAGLKSAMGALAYAAGALHAGLTAEPVDCTVLCDGERFFSGRCWQLTVACSGAFGGGSEVEADPADERLDIVVIEAGSRLRLVRHAYGLRLGQVEAQPGVRSCRCREARISTSHGGLAFNVDGELVKASDPMFALAPRALRLISG